MAGEMKHIWRQLGTSPSFPLHLVYWDLKSSRIMKLQLPRVRALSPLPVQEKIRPKQEFCPSEASYPSTARSLFAKVSMPRPGISRMTPTLEVQQVWCFQKLTCAMHSWSTNVWVLRRETDTPRAQQTCSPLPPGTKQCMHSEWGPCLGFFRRGFSRGCE